MEGKIINPGDKKFMLYHNYYMMAKYAAINIGEDVVFENDHPGKTIGMFGYDVFLVDNVVVVFADKKRVFYFDPEEVEVEVIDGGWMNIVRTLYETAVSFNIDKNKKR